MSQRFFVETPIKDEVAELQSTEAHHAIKVMRCRVGDRVVLFDGSGAEFPAEISRIARASVQLKVIERCVVDRELACALTIGVALPKGDRQRWLIEKSVELGVATVVPLVTERGVAQPGANTLDRLRRSVVEASKQCGRNRLMQITEPVPLADYCASVEAGGQRLFFTPGGDPWRRPAVELTELATCIGPEGGFTDDERQLAMARDWQPISLGRRILRIETAAIAVAATVATITETA